MSARSNKKPDSLCMKHSSTSNTVTPKGAAKECISPKYFLSFFSNLYIPPWLWKSFKFLVLRLLEDTFVLMPPSKTLPKAEGNYPFPPNSVSENLFRFKQVLMWRFFNIFTKKYTVVCRNDLMKDKTLPYPVF